MVWAPGNKGDGTSSEKTELCRAAGGLPLVFFDLRRKIQLTGHDATSEVYGNLSGGARLILTGSNFAPLGHELQCVFDTPNRRVGNETSNISTTNASFIAPTLVMCLSPSYGAIGSRPLHLNSTYNSSLSEGGAEQRQTVDFTWYEPDLPPLVRAL